MQLAFKIFPFHVNPNYTTSIILGIQFSIVKQSNISQTQMLDNSYRIFYDLSPTEISFDLESGTKFRFDVTCRSNTLHKMLRNNNDYIGSNMIPYCSIIVSATLLWTLAVI